jgi:hypothetical protein
MQVLHLIIATGFIFVFNRYAPIKNLYKILFSFGYFPLYEYAIISRSYGLGILLLFMVCALYKNRLNHYLLIGVILALLANVNIFMVVIGLGVAGIMFLDYIIYQRKNKKHTLQLIGGLLIFLAGVIFSLYQITPSKDNTFPVHYATDVFYYPRAAYVWSRLFSTYFYIPSFQDIHFWNSNMYLADNITYDEPFGQWLNQNNGYLWGWVYMPILVFISGIIIFLRRPLTLLLYIGTTLGLIIIFYYTGLLHFRYCGHLMIALIASYWISEYYPEKKFQNGFLRGLASMGKKMSRPFLILILTFNLIGAIVAYAIDFQNKFSMSKDAADYIRQNKMDNLTMLGTTDFVLSPIASYLDTMIYFPQMDAFGSYCKWNSKRVNDIPFNKLTQSVNLLMSQGRNKLLMIQSNPIRISPYGKNYIDLQKALLRKDVQLDLLTQFEGSIQDDEHYFLYLVQKVDSTKVDPQKYPLIGGQ